MTQEVDFLASAADYTITIPSGAHFFPNEVDVICTVQGGTVATQPTVRSGITGTLAQYLAASITTALTAALKRERFTTLLTYEGGATITGGVTIPGTLTGAGSYKGRFAFIGLLVEDE